MAHAPPKCPCRESDDVGKFRTSFATYATPQASGKRFRKAIRAKEATALRCPSAPIILRNLTKHFPGYIFTSLTNRKRKRRLS